MKINGSSTADTWRAHGSPTLLHAATATYGTVMAWKCRGSPYVHQYQRQSHGSAMSETATRYACMGTNRLYASMLQYRTAIDMGTETGVRILTS